MNVPAPSRNRSSSTREPWNWRVAKLSMTPLSGDEEVGGRGGPDHEARSRVSRCRGRARLDGSRGRGGAALPAKPISRCDWPMWGQRIERPFASPCQTEISPQTAKDLKQIWFFNAKDTVTATPAVVDGVAVRGRLVGQLLRDRPRDGEIALDLPGARARPGVRGQVVSSAAVADVKGVRTVFFAGGKTLYALRADNGRERWKHEVGRRGDDNDPSEIESSPVVADGLVVFGTDVHNSGKGEPAAVIAVDAATGRDALDDRDRPDRKARARPVLGAATCGARPPSTRRRSSSSSGPGTASAVPTATGDSPRRSSHSTSVPARCAGRTSLISRTATTSTSRARRTCSTPGVGPSSASATRTPRITPSTGPRASSSGARRSPSPASRDRTRTTRRAASSARRPCGRRRRGGRHRGRWRPRPFTPSTPPRARSSGSRPKPPTRTRRLPLPTMSCSSVARPTSPSGPSTCRPVRFCGRRGFAAASPVALRSWATT